MLYRQSAFKPNEVNAYKILGKLHTLIKMGNTSMTLEYNRKFSSLKYSYFS